MIKVLTKDSSKIQECSLAEFEELMEMRWLPSLEFQTDAILDTVQKRSNRAMNKKELNIRESWLGVRFQKEIVEGFLPKVNVQWINEVLGYGVFAEQDFPAGAFIGEYTGLIRKRIRRADRKNNYCFEYTIGDWLRNPYIIDARGQGNFTAYINHSNDPNVESLSVHANGVMHIILITVKKVSAGEQLGYHYGDTFWKKRRHAKPVSL